MTQAASRFKVIVFDDDPTGSQTVHSCPLLLRWDRATLRWGLAQPSPLLFLLANTRALAPQEAAARVREICRALRPLLAEAQAAGRIDHWLIVSRGDSTLRGHFPLEVEVIAEELGPFDATLLVPAFLPGGRTTVDGIHLLHGQPVHTTAFARDRLFGYSTSHLPAWVEEKSGGRIPADQVRRISLSQLDAAAADLQGADLRGADLRGAKDSAADQPRVLCRWLAGLTGNPLVVVDAERPEQLAALGAAVRRLTAPGTGAPPPHTAWGRPRHFLFQSAASLLNGLVELPPQPLDAVGLAALRRRSPTGEPLPGLVLVGSHVPLADAQLAALLAPAGEASRADGSGERAAGACAGVEIEVAKLAWVLEGPAPQALLASLEREWLGRLEAALAAGATPVLFSSRGELACASAAERRRLGLALAGLMARLAARLAPGLGYLISKGGITSHTLLADGLGLAAVQLQGQLLPGLSLVLTPDEAAVPALPVLTFPGNLGDAQMLRQAWALMQAG